LLLPPLPPPHKKKGNSIIWTELQHKLAAVAEERRQSHKHLRKKHSLPPLLLFTRTTVS
jgi:hypothetical protein